MIGKTFFPRYTPGELGCALAHRAAYEFVAEKNLEHALIIEDDVEIRIDKFFETVKVSFVGTALLNNRAC